MSFLFDLPLIVSGPALISLLVGASLAALGWFRKHKLPRLKFGDGDVEFGAGMLASIMVFYGLATALTAVQVWEGYEKVREINEQEASSLAAFYRNVSEYPEPLRSDLRGRVRTYTHQIITDAWPLQRRGVVPHQGVKPMNDLYTALVRFEPTTEAQKGLALETLASFDRMMEARRMRLGSVERRLPGLLWLVIVAGAFISLVSAFYFPVHEVRLHRVQVGLLAGFMGLVMFMIFALDRPYHGDLGLKPKPYELLYEQLMSE
jgi:hypothetical protein